MVIIVYSETSAALIGRNLGESEYSYYFVLQAFLPVLKQIGRVIVVTDPGKEVDAIHDRATRDGDECVFLSFSPPHRTPLNLACPTIPVIAWEYNTIPSEMWSGERHQDWRFVLNRLGRAITLSSFSAEAVRSAMGPDFPVASIPAPVFDRLGSLRLNADTTTAGAGRLLSVRGRVLDVQKAILSSTEDGRGSRPVSLELDGVIYAAVLNPHDSRKNYFDLLSGFCRAFRETEGATLVLKLSHHNAQDPIGIMMDHLTSLGPLQCRVILIDGYLSDGDYGNLLLATTFAVNTSEGEGQCIPLMESMSLGKPAVAPRHTAMIDYLTPANAFLVASTVQPAAWPQDPRRVYRALSHRIDFESLLNAFTESYRVATKQPERYAAMAEEAKKVMKQQNSDAVTLQRLLSFLARQPRLSVSNETYGTIPPGEDNYSLGEVVDFTAAIEARRFLGSGWDRTELGAGVWSNGPTAELHFHLAERPAEQLRLRINLTAFVVKDHPEITVHVSAEDVEIAHWNFGVAYPELVGGWREAIVPSEVMENGALSIKLHIDQPASPRKLKLSTDIRLLGILLHQLSLSPEAKVASDHAAS